MILHLIIFIYVVQKILQPSTTLTTKKKKKEIVISLTFYLFIYFISQ